MDPSLTLQLENKISAVAECNLQLKNRGLPPDDAEYTLKIKNQYLKEIKALLDQDAKLIHHPGLLRIEADLTHGHS